MRSSPSTAKPRTDLREYADEVLDSDNEVWRDELGATLLAAANKMDALARMGASDAPFSFWLGVDA